MTGVPLALAVGVPITVFACYAAAVQRWAWRRPPRTRREADARAAWELTFPYSQLGVRVGPDGWVYANLTGQCLGQAAGARAVLVPARPVHTLRPGIGWAVIYFADGTMHRTPYGLRNQAQAVQQAARFNAAHEHARAPGVFRRASRPSHAARL